MLALKIPVSVVRFHPWPPSLALFISKLYFVDRVLAVVDGALVPKPRINLTRFHGVFASNSKHRAPVAGQSSAAAVKPVRLIQGSIPA